MPTPKVSAGHCGNLVGRLPDFPRLAVGTWAPLSVVSTHLHGLKENEHPVVLISLKNIRCPAGCCQMNVFIRPKATDFTIMQNVFGGEYQFLLDKSGFHPRTILDAGSNVGMSSLLFALYYPKATVVAVEPESENFEILLLNARRFGNVYAEKKGLWSRDTFLDVSAPDHNDEFHSGTLRLPASKRQDAFVVKEVSASESNVQAVSVESLLAQHHLQCFEMIKMDVEGAEKTLFDHHPNGANGDPHGRDWLEGVKLLMAETHDRFVPGSSAAMQTVADALQRPFKKALVSELTVWEFTSEK